MTCNAYLSFDNRCREAFQCYERVALNVETVARAEAIFNALAQGGRVQMPFEETFWAKKFGMVTDRFGIPWVINGEPTM